MLWAIIVSVTSPGLRTRESVSQTALDAGGLAQNSTVRDRRWPVTAVKVLLAGYTAGRPEIKHFCLSSLKMDFYLRLSTGTYVSSKDVSFWET